MFDSTAILKKEQTTLDAYLNPVKAFTEREVYVKPRSVYASDFYQAAQAGLRPSVVLEMFGEDYEGEDVIVFNGTEYTVIRTYWRPDRDAIELTLEARIQNGG